jgi:hypothetical protein
LTTAVGGDGGNGAYISGNGANSSLSNASTGSTYGALLLSQLAIGGESNVLGGNANATFSIVDSHASSLILSNTAIGGNGSTINNNLYQIVGNGNGGAATTNSNATSIINSTVSVNDSATGGNGGRFVVGSEEARRSASLRPPLKLDMQFYRIQLSRKRGLPRCN